MITATQKLQKLILQETQSIKVATERYPDPAMMILMCGEKVLKSHALIQVCTEAIKVIEAQNEAGALKWFTDQLIRKSRPNHSTCVIANLNDDLTREAISKVIEVIEYFLA